MPSAEAPALERGLQILQLLRRAGKAVSFANLLKQTDIPRASLIRLLAVLRRLGYVHSTNDGHQLGPAIRGLQLQESIEDRLRDLLPDVLEQLSRQCRLTSACFCMSGNQLVCMDKHLHMEGLVMQPVGSHSMKLGCNPWGWLFQEYGDPHAIHSMLAEEPMLPTDKQVRGQAFSQFATQGYIFDNHNGAPHWLRWAVPIFHPHQNQRNILACLALGAVPIGFDSERIAWCGQTLVQAAEKLEKALSPRA